MPGTHSRHLSLTMSGIQAQMQATHKLAHDYCHGRWIALGGGGYDLYRSCASCMEHSLERDEQSAAPPTPTGELELQQWRPAWLAEQVQEEAAQSLDGQGRQLRGIPETFLDRPEPLPRPNQDAGISTIPTTIPSPWCATFSFLHLGAQPFPRQASALTTRRLFDLCYI